MRVTIVYVRWSAASSTTAAATTGIPFTSMCFA
jgi:hypothetical protein